MPNSSAVVDHVTAANAAYMNALRDDIIDPSTGHDHSGAAEHGVVLSLTGMADVDDTDLADDNVLVWDVVSGTFKPSSVAATPMIGKHGTLGGNLRLAIADASETGTADWNLATGAGSFDSHTDPILRFGFNAGAGGRQVESVHALYQVTEAYYYVGASEHYAEWYLEYISASGSITIRPIQTSVQIDAGVTRAINQFCGDNQFKNSAGAVRLQYASDAWFFDDCEIQKRGSGDVQWQTSGGSFLFYGSPALVHMTNNAYFIKQMNAAGNDYGYIWFNAADRWCIGGNAFIYGDCYFCNPATVGGTIWYGPIVQDRVSPYTVYRLKVESGVLGLEAV